MLYHATSHNGRVAQRKHLHLSIVLLVQLQARPTITSFLRGLESTIKPSVTQAIIDHTLPPIATIGPDLCFFAHYWLWLLQLVARSSCDTSKFAEWNFPSALLLRSSVCQCGRGVVTSNGRPTAAPDLGEQSDSTLMTTTMELLLLAISSQCKLSAPLMLLVSPLTGTSGHNNR